MNTANLKDVKVLIVDDSPNWIEAYTGMTPRRKIKVARMSDLFSQRNKWVRR